MVWVYLFPVGFRGSLLVIFIVVVWYSFWCDSGFGCGCVGMRVIWLVSGSGLFDRCGWLVVALVCRNTCS